MRWRRVLPSIAALAAVGVAGTSQAGGAAAPRVELMVAGKSRVLFGATRVRAAATTVRLGSRSCAVGAGTPLAALLAGRRGALTLRDYGSCGRRAVDSASLFVTSIDGERNRAQDGWVYKVRRRVPGIGAADPAARLRSGDRLLWFYCRQGAHGCQRTLETRISTATVASGASLRLTVVGYDDRGRGRSIPGAVATLGGRSAVTRANGVATLHAPLEAGSYALRVIKPGLVPAFPRRVRVT